MNSPRCEACGYERAERVFICRLCWQLLPWEWREAWAMAHAAGDARAKLPIAAQVSEWAKGRAELHNAWRRRKGELVGA